MIRDPYVSLPTVQQTHLLAPPSKHASLLPSIVANLTLPPCVGGATVVLTAIMRAAEYTERSGVFILMASEKLLSVKPGPWS